MLGKHQFQTPCSRLVTRRVVRFQPSSVFFANRVADFRVALSALSAVLDVFGIDGILSSSTFFLFIGFGADPETFPSNSCSSSSSSTSLPSVSFQLCSCLRVWTRPKLEAPALLLLLLSLPSCSPGGVLPCSMGQPSGFELLE